MVDNSTWAGMKAMNLRYVVACTRCDRMVEIDLDKMPPEGNAINQRFRWALVRGSLMALS
ncbi:hypothetical protein DTW90_37365 [Neorhizobium sp. P12A]|uniref:hypothetical protein n=1 Tax=Rhizobium/Agrobacterium group TaxID=227290 RepID=UPI0010536A2A|nr:MULTISPECIES: hypothetical protein [Rhizobium/Agrobacterium group]KAA0680254.1 hypothetical protein DTW90_37365 [Neorhizobium sp. P12A]TCR67853.1 hypothetical protein EV561_14911 [Rhizobium sp. BK376]